MELPPEFRDLTWKVVKSRTTKTSLRFQCFMIYAYTRFCDILDYWFPVKMTLREARRIWGSDMTDEVLRDWVKAKNARQSNFHKDDPNIPRGATIETPSI